MCSEISHGQSCPCGTHCLRLYIDVTLEKLSGHSRLEYPSWTDKAVGYIAQ